MFDFHFFSFFWTILFFSEKCKMQKKKSVDNFHFFLDSKRKWNETKPKIKKNNQSRYNRFSRNCCISFFKPASILFDVLKWRTIISFFFSGEGEGRVERRVKKTQVTAERLAQKFGVSHTADYCHWADVFQVSSQRMHMTTMEELKRLMMR